jgi:hypothetical protein
LKSYLFRLIIAEIIFISLVIAIFPPFLHTVFAADKTKPDTPQTPAALMPSAVHPITEAAVKAGILSCASRINQVSNFLTADNHGTGIYLFIPPSIPDQSIFSVSMEVQGSNASTTYASESFAPNQAGGCGSLYEEVIYLPMSCNEAAKKYFSGMKRERELLKNITILGDPPTVHVFLMPAGSGCVVIKKEVIR